MAGVNQFRASGHWPTLLTAFIYFDFSFAVWVLLGTLGVFISGQFDLSVTQTAWMIAIPTLGGALFRIPLGYLADRAGAKPTAIAAVILSMVPLFIGWLSANALPVMYTVAVLLGIAGASFAVAMPLGGRWYSARRQGLVLGLVGAGNTGTLLATFFAARIAKNLGWHADFGIALIPLFAVLLLLIFVAREAPREAPPVESTGRPAHGSGSVFRNRDAWVASLFYALTFGGFVGVSSYMSVYFHTQFGLPPVRIADVLSLLALAGSAARPLGGWMADHLGAPAILTAVFAGLAVSMLALVATRGLAPTVVLLFLIMALFGLGNGALFQFIPQIFPGNFGLVTGMVGEAGGLGGFFLPMILGYAKVLTGSYQMGFAVLAIVALAALATALRVRAPWMAQSSVLAAMMDPPPGDFKHRGEAHEAR